MGELPPQYNPQQVEETRYQWWESQGLFQADVDPKRTPYTIVIPPPNVTGILHMGHALNNTIQDILIRWKRMQGDNALWIPGTDHAGIATQNVVEKALAKEGKRRQDLGREAFIQRVWEWKEQYGNTILYQLKRLGSSCDWRRTRFTMDAGLSDAVTEVFLQLYQKGLIYRGNYIINWCPRCQTALADEEAPRQETLGKLYHIRYKIKSESLPADLLMSRIPQFIEVATTRPETMFGDAAIAVHPKDKRYKHLIGGRVFLPLVNRELPIIKDEVVDPKFGTGAVKVTPAHDPVDFQIAKRNDALGTWRNVMTDDGHMVDVPAPYAGLERFECRSKLIVDLEQRGYLGAIEEYRHNVGHCYRCHTVVEPRLSLQWFVKMKPLTEPAIKAVKSGELKFVPERWTKVYLNWMENIEDWCISRQIWWGHRLPVYYCSNCRKGQETGDRRQEKPKKPVSRLMSHVSEPGVIVSKTRPTKCPSCGGSDLRQDDDVLDTWFSSWLWPFSTLGWPKKTKDLEYFYPTDTLVTAQEIIFFWVARMVMAGYFCMKDLPFRNVYIHGTVRDITGKKMSKSLGNIIDPLEIIKQYGTDALRYTLVTATTIGQDVFLSEERFVAGRNFANKIWNATRLVLSIQKQYLRQNGGLELDRQKEGVADRWIRSRFHRTVARVTEALDSFRFSDAATALYDFLWHDYCDWYLEIVKAQVASGRLSTWTAMILPNVLEEALRLLHPIMPFVSEELWQHLQGWRQETRDRRRETVKPRAPHPTPLTPASIMLAPWPKPSAKLIDEEAERLFERFQAVVIAIRNTRAELNVPLESRPSVCLAAKEPTIRKFFEAHRPLIQAIAQVGEITVGGTTTRPKDAAASIVDGVEVLVPLAGLIDVERERVRLKQKVDELTNHLTRLETRLGDPQFTQKAPKEVVDQTKALRNQARETLKKFSEHLAVLQSM